MPESNSQKPGNTIGNSIPFSMYDFFGYLFPGLILVLGLFLYGYFELHLRNSILEDQRQLLLDLKKIFEMSPLIFGTLLMLMGLVGVYLIGHVVATISHIIIDRLIVGNVIQYPYTLFLRISKKQRAVADIVNRVAIFLFFSMIVFCLIANFTQENLIATIFFKVFFVALCVLVFIRICLIIIRAYKEESKWPDDHKVYMWLIKESQSFDRIFTKPIQQILMIDKPFEDEQAECIRNRIKTKLNLDSEKAGSDNFWYPCLYSMRNETYAKMIYNWLHLYSLNRNVCTSFFILLLIPVYSSFHSGNYNHSVWISVTSALMLFFGGRYLMLYYTYYTKNVFRSFMILTGETDCSQGQNHEVTGVLTNASNRKAAEMLGLIKTAISGFLFKR